MFFQFIGSFDSGAKHFFFFFLKKKVCFENSYDQYLQCYAAFCINQRVL